MTQTPDLNILEKLTKTDCMDRIDCFQRISTSQHLWTKVLTKILPENLKHFLHNQCSKTHPYFIWHQKAIFQLIKPNQHFFNENQLKTTAG